MNVKKFIAKISLSLAASTLVMVPHVSVAGQGDGELVDVPLFLNNGADPNILFLFDTSGSMAGQRINQLRQAATTLVNTVDDVNLGLARFSNDIPIFGSLGARLLAEVLPISDAAHQGNLRAEISGLVADGSTPLATSLWQMGGYFTFRGEGDSTFIPLGDLTLHPGEPGRRRTAPAVSLGIEGAVFSNTFTGVPASVGPINRVDWCAENVIALLTDGAPTSDSHIDATLGIHDYDGDGDSAPTSNFASIGSTFLDDIAAMLDDIDLRPDVDRLDRDGNVLGPIKNNITTHVIAFGDFIDNDRNVRVLLNDTRDNVDGGLLLRAGNENDLLQAFRVITNSTPQQNATGGSVTFNSAFLTANTAIYQTIFNTRFWNGNLFAFPFLGGSADNCSGDFCWNAATELETRPANDRRIFTSNGRNGLAFTNQNFGAFSQTQQADLNLAATENRIGRAAVVNYLRGDASNQAPAGALRERLGKLGDIIHSDPVFVAEPNDVWLNIAPFPTAPGETYRDFINANSNRTEMVYVGANDGMLHAFNARTGSEEFAFMPESIFSTDNEQGVHYLASQFYFHKAYVDNTPTITDAYVDNAWRSILVGSLRGGGRGVFALDVTDPTAFEANDVLWEFTHPDLGLTYAKPAIAMTNIKVGGEATEQRWAAIFGNGYDSGQGSKLFIVFLDGPNGDNGTFIESDFVVLDAGEQIATASGNGLSTPTLVDVDGDGTVDRVYAGDMAGDLYAFDISSDNLAQWQQQRNRIKLYDGTPEQPLTTKPAVAEHPNPGPGEHGANFLVYFGSGAFIAREDDVDASTQSFYAVWDRGDDDITRGQLQNIEYLPVTDPLFAENNRVLENETIAWSGDPRQLGWFIDLDDTRERATNPPEVFAGFVFFNTIVPDTSIPCITSGSGWLYSLRLENGESPRAPLFDINEDGAVGSSDRLNVGEGSGESGTPPGARRFGDDGLPLVSVRIGDRIITPTTNGAPTNFDDEGEVLPPNIDDAPDDSQQDPTALNAREGRLTWKEIRE